MTVKAAEPSAALGKLHMADATTLITGFSLLDPQTQSRPAPFYALLHEHCPVYRMPETGMYVITRYEDVRSVLRNTEQFSNDLTASRGINAGTYDVYQQILKARGWGHVQTLQRTDPPRHGRYRRLLDEVFNVLQVRALTPHIAEVAHGLIDGFIDAGECEFVSQFALPLPGIIIAEQLGLNRNDVATFKKWADGILAPAMLVLSESELRATAEIELEMQHFLAKMFEDRRSNPKADLISALVNAKIAGEEPLSMHELQNLMHQLISGGYDTTISALANGLWLLLRHPEQMQKLRKNPDLLKGFVDESLRVESPVQGLMRRATCEVVVANVTIPRDSLVMVRYAAANLDEEKFACPHQFDIERQNAGAHLAFGNGVHFCVGRLLARQELMTGFEVLLSRLTDITLAAPLPDPPHHPSLLLHSMKTLPIRFAGR